MDYQNRRQRRQLYKKHHKKLQRDWKDFNSEFIKKQPIENDKTK